MNSLNSILTTTIFALLLISSILLIVLMVRCYKNRSKEDRKWLNGNRHNSNDDEIERNNEKGEEKINAQVNNPEELMISDEIEPYYNHEQKSSERKIILNQHRDHDNEVNKYTNNKNSHNGHGEKVINYCHETITTNENNHCHNHEPKRQLTATAIIIESPEIDNFNQTEIIEPKIIFYDDKLEQSTYY